MGDLLKSEGGRVAIHQCEAPEIGFCGEVPALPGCASQGKTREECRANVIEAVMGCLESYIEFAMQKLKATTPMEMAAFA